MGIAERKERERTELKSRIMGAARQLFTEKGYENTSMRNIASVIEYSPGTIYHYFKDKGEIFHALHAEGFTELGQKMVILDSVPNPMERLKAMGKIYIEFAMENPEMYGLMFIESAPLEFLEAEKNWKEGETVYRGLENTVADCIQNGYFEGHDVEPLTYMFWSTVHGMVSLQLRKRCDVISEVVRESIVEDSYKSLLMIMDKH
ncbi:MAG: TetR/AcrR family transcriptional regulator [Bacteroidota bacterium]